MTLLTPNTQYRHARTGHIYTVRAVLVLPDDHYEGVHLQLRAPLWEDATAAGDLIAGQPSVVYARAIFSRLWVRDRTEFLDGRFELVPPRPSLCGYYAGDAINRKRIPEVMAAPGASEWQIELDPNEPGEYLIQRKVV